MIISGAAVGKGQHGKFQYSSTAAGLAQVRLNHLLFFEPAQVILGVSQLDEDLSGVLPE